MIRDAGFRVALVAAALLLGACVGQRTKPVRADAAALANQAAREAALATMDDWSLRGLPVQKER